MTFNDVKIEYKPVRIGFCIRSGNKRDLLTAAKINATLWGGAYNPIIPVGDKEGIDESLVKLFQVDLLVPVAETTAINKFIEKHKWAMFPLRFHSRSVFSQDVNNQKKQVINILDISHLLRKLWEKEFKFTKSNSSNCYSVSWDHKDKDRELFTLMFGEYYSKNLSTNYFRQYKKALRAKEANIKSSKTVPSILASVITPVNLTEQEIETLGGGHRAGAGIYVGDTDNFSDLLNFWNLRAAGCYICFVSIKNAKRYISFARVHCSRIRATKSPFDRFLYIWHAQTVPEAQSSIDQIAKSLKIKGRSFIQSVVSSISWNGLNISPTENFFSDLTTLATLNVRQGKPSLNIQLQDKPFSKTTDLRFPGQLMTVTVRPPTSIDVEGFTLNLPPFADLFEWYGDNILFDRNSLRVKSGIFGMSLNIITEIHEQTIQVSYIPKDELITKIFERAGVKVEKSSAGLIAERLISQMKGVTGSARIFKITGVRKFIEETNPLRQKLKDEITLAIRDKTDSGESFKNFENEFGLKGRTPLTPEDVFDELIEHNLLQVGIEVRCPNCNLKNWMPLRDVDENYVCEFCSEKSKFTSAIVTNSANKIDGIQFHYRLSGLLGRGDKQEGSIPVILALMFFSNRIRIAEHDLYSTALNFSFVHQGKTEKGESDLALFDLSSRSGKEQVEVLLGECKTAHQITRSQVDRLADVKALLEKSGIKCYLVFAKTKKEFSDTEIRQFKRLVKNGTRPILLTAHELEPWWNEYKYYESKRADFQIPHKHPLTYSELADNSVYVYELDK